MVQHPLSNDLKGGVRSLSPLLFIFFIYLITISPSIYWSDAPEFIITSWDLGISHPPGHPLYNLIGKGFSFVPFGDITFRSNFLSLISGFLTIIMLYQLIVKVLSIISPSCSISDSGDKQTAQVSIKTISLLSTLLFAFSYSFWMNTTVTEVYTLNALFLVIILYFAVSWMEKEDQRYLLTGSFIYGLSTGVHGGVAFFLPGLLLFLIANKRLLKIRDIFFVVFFFLLGFSIYLYLPVRSLSNPTIDWGNPETFRQFLVHITDRKDSGFHYSFLHADLKGRSIFYIKMLVDELTLFGVLLSIAGIIFNIKKNRRLFLLFFGITLGNSLFFFPYWDNGIAFIPSLLILAIWIAMGLNWFFLSLPYFRIISKKTIIALSIIFICFQIFKNFGSINKSSYYNAYVTAREDYLSAEPNAVIFCMAMWFPFRHMQDIEGLRQDIIIISISDLLSPQYFNPVVKDRFPDLAFPETRESWEKFIISLISLNIKNRPLYWEPSKFIKQLYRNLRPYRFLLRISPERKENLDDASIIAYLQWMEGFFKKEFERIDLFNDREAQIYYSYLLGGIADYFILIKREGYAINLYKIAKAIRPEDLGIDKEIAFCYARMGNFQKAKEVYEDILKKHPDDSDAHLGLGLVLIDIGKVEDARPHLNIVMKGKKNPWSFYGMGRVYSLEKNFPSAVSCFEEALSMKPEKELREIIEKEMELIKRMNEQLKDN